MVRASSPQAADEALSVGRAAFSAAVPAPADGAPTARPAPRSLSDARLLAPTANVAVVSVPGDYAALAAYQALSNGLHVLLFSDNVSVAKEVALKRYAAARGLLLMGPGAGTAMLGGAGLGFANAVKPGPVGVVAAAGTGAQEAMALLDRWGVGVSQVIGLGGHDLSAEVGGEMARSAIDALQRDPATEVILVISKPPSPDVAAAVLAGSGRTPIVAALIGLDPTTPAPSGVVLADTLESGVVATLRTLGRAAPDTTVTAGPSVLDARRRLAPERRWVRGLFSGGTLCYESLVVLGRVLGAVYSNTPLNPAWGLPAPRQSHQCLDLGEEEYTRGRPHPMIDPAARSGAARRARRRPGGGRDHSRRGAGLWGESGPSRDAGARLRGRDGGRRSAGRRVRPRHRSRSAGLSRAARGARRRRLHRHGDRVPRVARRGRHRGGRSDRRDPAGVTIGSESADRPRVALVSYSTKPRGGVVHTLYLAEELARAGVPVQVVTLGDPDHGFFREVQAPYRVIAAPPPAADAGATSLQLDRCARRRSR